MRGIRIGRNSGSSRGIAAGRNFRIACGSSAIRTLGLRSSFDRAVGLKSAFWEITPHTRLRPAIELGDTRHVDASEPLAPVNCPSAPLSKTNAELIL